MSDLDYDALRKVAERASTINSLAAAIGGERWKLDGWPQEAIDHIAEFDPPTVLRLLDLAQRAEADRAAVERVRALADEAQPAISHGPADCKNTCWDGACTCSGIPRPLGWTLGPEAIRVALDPCQAGNHGGCLLQACECVHDEGGER